MGCLSKNYSLLLFKLISFLSFNNSFFNKKEQQSVLQIFSISALLLLSQAIEAQTQIYTPDNTIFVTGSTVIHGEIVTINQQEPRQTLAFIARPATAAGLNQAYHAPAAFLESQDIKHTTPAHSNTNVAMQAANESLKEAETNYSQRESTSTHISRIITRSRQEKAISKVEKEEVTATNSNPFLPYSKNSKRTPDIIIVSAAASGAENSIKAGSKKAVIFQNNSLLSLNIKSSSTTSGSWVEHLVLKNKAAAVTYYRQSIYSRPPPFLA